VSVDKYSPHLFILPEDNANRQIANGFAVEFDERQVQVKNEIGGWRKVVDACVDQYAKIMRDNQNCSMVLLIDFDESENRLEYVKRAIPDELIDRVFVIGAKGEPEDLRKARLGTFEEIGIKIAKCCRDGTNDFWNHELLKNNLDELSRLKTAVCHKL
jgi:hypothetical protein